MSASICACLRRRVLCFIGLLNVVVAVCSVPAFSASPSALTHGVLVPAIEAEVPSSLVITTSSFPNGIQDTSYTQTTTASGGKTPYTWSVSVGSLPNGLTLKSANGRIAGVPGTTGSFNFTLKVSDSSNKPKIATRAFTIVIQAAPLVITSTSPMPQGTEGSYYTDQLTITGGTKPFNCTVVSGALPEGLTLSASNGYISGKPTLTGSSDFTIQISDSSSPPQQTSKDFALTVQPAALKISSGSPSGGTVGADYSFPFTATGGTPPYAWTISSGKIPKGTGLGSSSGILSGKPNTGQTVSFTVLVTDSQKKSASQSDSITVSVPPPPPNAILLAIQVQPITPTLTVGGTLQMSATGVFSNGTTQDLTSSVTWSSLANSILSINLLGLATGISQGTTTVTAATKGMTGYSVATVGSLLAGSPGSGGHYYVATDGNDKWSGTIPSPNNGGTDGPFATLDRARKAVQGKPGSVVQIENGTYFLPATVNFTSADSGTAAAPIVYENYPGATPVISGGIKLKGWTDSNGAWKVSLNSKTYPNLQNFESLFYAPSGANDGTRRYRPRAAIPSNGSCASGYLCNSTSNPVVVSNESTNCDAQVSNGWECFDRFHFNPGDISSSGYHGMGLGDVEVLDFEYWTMSRMRLSSVNSSSNIVYLTGPTYDNPNTNGFFSGHRYLIENVLEALSSESLGEWYLDRCPGCANTVNTPAATWTLSYIAQSGENPSNDTIIAPQLPQLIVGTGASNLVFQGLTFSHDNWTPPSTGFGDQQGAAAVSAAVSFLNSQNVVFDSCIFSHIQGWGIEFRNAPNTSGGVSNQVVNSEFYDLGAGGVRIGTVPTSADTDANVPQYNLVQNNVIVAGGRIQPTGIGTGIWVGDAHHTVIAHNDVSDLYSGGIGVGLTFGISKGTGFAHDNIVAFNHVYTLGQGVTSDMGGIYFATSATNGNMMLNNVVHDVTHNYLDADGYGGDGLYFDQGTSNAIAQNNLVYRLSSSGLFNNLSDRTTDTYPQNNTVVNNIFALGAQVTIQHGGTNPNSLNYVRNVDYYDLAILQGGNWACYDIGGSGQPVPCPTRFLLDSNDYWNPNGNALWFETTYPQTQTYSLSQWQPLGEDVHSFNVDPLFTNPNQTNDPPANGFTLQSSSPVFADIGFVNFDPNQAGRSNPVLVPPTINCSGVQTVGACPAFPLEVLSQENGY